MAYLFAPNGDRLMDASNVDPLTDDIPVCPSVGVNLVVFTTMMSLLFAIVLIGVT